MATNAAVPAVAKPILQAPVTPPAPTLSVVATGATATGPQVFGPNDHNMLAGAIGSGLGDIEEAKIRQRRGMVVSLPEPPDRVALRAQATALQAKAKQLSLVEQELEKERAKVQDTLDAQRADLEAREAMLAASLKALEG